MKILYGIQGTGNGHLSRARFIYKLLIKQSKNVDVLVSGNNYSLKTDIPIKYHNKGFSFVINNGHIDYLKTLGNFNMYTSYLEQREVPFQNYDIIITDFEPITAWSSIRYSIPSIHISHQASFIDNNVPRPSSKNMIGEYIMKYFCPTNEYIGLHYKQYGPSISEPIISPSLMHCNIELNDHITIYLPWYDDNFIYNFFKKHKELSFHIFSKNINKKYTQDNIRFFPIDEVSFLHSLSTSYGVICNAGFQTSSEVMYLGKRLLVIPVGGQYEQFCNVAALNNIGIHSLDNLTNHSHALINSWLSVDPVKLDFKNNIEELLIQKINKILK